MSMKVINKNDIPHKIALYSLLRSVLSDQLLSQQIYFKGGTCASMLGYLDRFSVDLDFDLIDNKNKEILRERVHQIIARLGFEIKDESQQHLQFFIKYRHDANVRNTLKLEIVDIVAKANKYELVNLADINMHCHAQTVDTMFANKLVALQSRFEKTGKIAGRDVYDIHHFFKKNYDINLEVIEELRSKPVKSYFSEVIEFIDTRVTIELLRQDLNPLVSATDLRKILPELKGELLVYLRTYVGMI